MNKIVISGNLGKDAELKYSQAGMAVLKFSIADKQGKEQTNWWNCTMFGKRAESLAQMLNKGTKLIASGKVTIDKKDDKTYYNVIVDDIELLGGKPKAEEPTGQSLDDLNF